MPETFRRLTSRGVGTTATRVGGYTVPVDGVAIVIGMSIANVLTSVVNATLQHSDGTNLTNIVAAVPLQPSQSLAPAGEVNKVVLQAGDGLFATSGTASGLDVLVSILEITP